MSVFDDSRLKGYQSELKRMIEDQSKYSAELTRLRTRMAAELENVTRSYKSEITNAEKEIDYATRNIPEVQRKVERRQEELAYEAKVAASKSEQKK